MPDVHTPITFTLDEIPGLVGTEFTGTWLTVEQETIAMFDKSTYVDDDKAGYSFDDYPTGMFEGLHTLGMIYTLVESGFQIRDFSAMGLVYGFDRVRFTSPVHAGQQLRAHGIVEEVRPRGDAYNVGLAVTVSIRGQEVPAYVAKWWVLYQPVGRINLTPPSETISGATSE